MSKRTTPAATAEEYRAKYGRKRLNDSTLIRAYLLNQIYHKQYPNETDLYDFAKVEAKRNERIDSNEAVWINCYNYDLIANDIENKAKEATLHYDRVMFIILYFTAKLKAATAAEVIRADAGQDIKAAEAWRVMHAISLDSLYTESISRNESHIMASYTKTLMDSMRYIHAFNECIKLLAEALDIPEIEYYDIDTSFLVHGIEVVNELIETIKNNASYRLDEANAPEESVPDFTGTNGLYHDKTHELIRKAFKTLKPIPTQTEPIPDNTITELKTIARETTPLPGLSELMEKLRSYIWRK